MRAVLGAVPSVIAVLKDVVKHVDFYGKWNDTSMQRRRRRRRRQAPTTTTKVLQQPYVTEMMSRPLFRDQGLTHTHTHISEKN